MGSKSAKVEVYWNLHQDCWSVRYNNKVVAHYKELIVENADFIVQQGGRARVLKSKKKNVHAFVRTPDAILPFNFLNVPKDARRVRYNPYRWSSFVDESEKTINHANHVFMMSDGKCYVK